MREMTPVKRTGSHAGFHFVSLFSCCPRKFYYRHVLRWRPKHTAMPLVLGSAFHEAKAAWYQKKSYAASYAIGRQIVEESKDELDSIDTYNSIMFRLEGLFRGWVDAFGKLDRTEFKFLAIEKELKVPIAGTPFVMTMRPDAVVQGKHSGLILIMETKTSGFSHRLTAESVAYGDQATSYLWGVQKAMGLKPYAVQADIAYWNKQSTDPNNRKFIRPDLIFRSESRLQEFEAGMAQLFTEITQKTAALKKGYSYTTLFPRNSYYCLSFSTPCDYAEICGAPCPKRMPSIFTKDPKPPKIGDLVADYIAAN